MPILQGRFHYPDCKCLQCAKFSAICKCEKCGEGGREFTTFLGLRRHQTAKPALKRGSKNPPRAAVVPDGLGFLTKVLANQDQLQKYNLSVISRFCAALNDMRPTKYHGRFTRAHKRILEEVSQPGHNTLLPFSLELPSPQAQAVLKLAQSVNMSPNSVLALLVQYGLEHLSSELRRNSVAPPAADPKVNKTTVQQRQTAAQEVLKEEPITHVVIEYSTPTNKPVESIRSSLFPST
jgi:hypothetical protein